MDGFVYLILRGNKKALYNIKNINARTGKNTGSKWGEVKGQKRLTSIYVDLNFWLIWFFFNSVLWFSLNHFTFFVFFCRYFSFRFCYLYWIMFSKNSSSVETLSAISGEYKNTKKLDLRGEILTSKAYFYSSFIIYNFIIII